MKPSTTKSSSSAHFKRVKAKNAQDIETYDIHNDAREEDDDLYDEMGYVGNSMAPEVIETPSHSGRDWENEDPYEMPVVPSYMRSIKREILPYDTSSSEAVEPLSDVSVEVSHNKRWNPISFARSEMFDNEAGVPLCRNSIEINREIRSSKKCSDQSAISLNTFVTSKIGFNIGCARQNEVFIYLPSGRRFKMSSTMTTFSSSNYTSSNYVTDAKSIVRRALTKVSESDPFFAAYTSSETSSVYVPLGADFFRSISKFLMFGFIQKFSEELETFTIRLCRDVACSLLDRTRSQFNQNHSTTSSVELARDLKKFLDERAGRIPIVTLEFSSSDHPTSQASSSSTFRL
ncbi:hypothetical protein GCK72_016597 [Caenorhabditis remanei]|uniref:Uncharacterized protein n=1 Tax=Caenorhabditis remanei TaxID=31234 RepID=A0A6A5G5P8_CAERE|nr:hypothetical protein GCK72_016597 [Caenorhabditis remanei]KAF1750052.1 hypothetical protein GCK72_016597 [Caenorhabditis remanei]